MIIPPLCFQCKGLYFVISVINDKLTVQSADIHGTVTDNPNTYLYIYMSYDNHR